MLKTSKLAGAIKYLIGFLLLCTLVLGSTLLTGPNKMTRSVQHQITIDLPLAQCWEKARNFGVAHHYVPGVIKTEITTDKKEGLGASRRV